MTNVILTIAAALLRRVTTSARQGQGGVIDWFGTNSVQAEADRRKQYGKLARITEMRAEAGGHYCLSVFEGKQKRIRPTVSGGVSR